MEASERNSLISQIEGPCGFIEIPLHFMLKWGWSANVLAEVLQRQCMCDLQNSFWDIDLETMASKRHLTMKEMGEILIEIREYLDVRPTGKSTPFQARVNTKLLLSDIHRFMLNTLCGECDRTASKKQRSNKKDFSDAAKQFVNAFRERHPWYPRKLDPRQTARELSAAEFLLASSTQDEIFALVDRVLAGFVGNRRKVGMIKDLWENFSALRVEYSETGGLTPEQSARIAAIDRDCRREKTDSELETDWQEYVAYCASVGKVPDEAYKPECLRRSKTPQDVLGGIDPHAAGSGL